MGRGDSGSWEAEGTSHHKSGVDCGSPASLRTGRKRRKKEELVHLQLIASHSYQNMKFGG